MEEGGKEVVAVRADKHVRQASFAKQAEENVMTRLVSSGFGSVPKFRGWPDGLALRLNGSVANGMYSFGDQDGGRGPRVWVSHS